MKFPKPVRKKKARKRRPDYAQWIVDTGRCEVCNVWPTDPDHEPGRGARGNVYHDDCYPLCRRHHVEKGQIGRDSFRARHNLPPYAEIVAKWQARYKQEVEQGVW
jgi:hypothetical protein